MTVQKTKDTITGSLQKIKNDLAQLPRNAYDYWVSITPIKTGNARRRTRLQGETISANYPYAVPLDEGHSKQAPNGMSKPTEKFVEQQSRKIMRK